jgi:O-antigen ligase
VSRSLDRLRARVERAIPELLIVGAFVLPLVVVTVLHDAFVLPKLMLMLALSGALLIGLAVVAVVPEEAMPGAAARGGTAPHAGGRFAVRRLPLATKALVAYVVLVAIATIHSPDRFQSIVGQEEQFQGLGATVAYAVAYFAAVRCLGDTRRFRDVLVAAVAAGFVVGLYGILQFVGLDPLFKGLFKGLIFSTLGNHTALAAFLVLAFPLALGLTAGGERYRRISAGIAALAIAVSLALAFSRGGYVGAVLSLLVFAALLVKRSTLVRWRVALAGTAGLIIIGAGAIAVTPASQLIGRVIQRAESSVDVSDESIATHLDLWAVGIRMAIDNPILGIGPEMYPIVFPDYRDRILPPDRAAFFAQHTAESPHDVPLAIADGAGLPALAAYMLLLVAAFRSGLRRLKSASGLDRFVIGGVLAAVAGHFATDLFMTADVAASWIFWVLLGTLGSVGVRATARRGDPSDSS